MSLGDNLLILSSDWIAKTGKKLRKTSAQGKPVSTHEIIEDLQPFCPNGVVPSKRALLSLNPEAWLRAVASAPNIGIFNIDGLTYEVVKALNLKGYSVDIVSHLSDSFVPEKHYHFYLGHGPNTRNILDKISSDTFVMQYMSGAYWMELSRQSQERYDHFCRRKALPLTKHFTRSFTAEQQAGEEFLTRRADAAFISGPRTTAQYRGISRNVSTLYLGAYIEEDLLVQDRDFEAGRKNFLSVACTGGNIQKGLDLLIEAFAQMPDLHLYIYCKVEDEVRRAYKRELALKNIHFIYHYKFGPLRAFMRALMKNINFTVSAPIDIGPGTAFLGSMGLGLIPVGFVDIEAQESDSVLTNTWSIEEISRVCRAASEKSAQWCQEASKQTLDRFQRLHYPPSFGLNFKSYLDRLGL